MAATGLLKVGESITVSFMWEDASDGSPLTSLSPAPTLAVTAPDGTVTTPSLTQRGSTAFFDYEITPDAAGLWALQARCTDTDCAAEYTEVVPLWVTTNALSDVQAKTSQLQFTGSVGQEKVNSVDDHLDDEIAAILLKTNLISAGNITLSDPLNATTKRLTLIKGDSYEADTPRPLVWESADYATFDIASVAFKYRSVNNATAAVTKAGTALSTTQMRVELTSTETGALEVGNDAYNYDLEATLTNGDIVTLARGKITVIADVR